MTPFGLNVYRATTAAGSPALPTLLRRRLARGKEHPTRWRERLGFTEVARPPGRLLWLHGASVGEGLSLLPLIEAVQSPQGVGVLVTTGTVTSADLLAKRLPTGVIHQFAPVDTPAVARRFLAHWRPDTAVFAESEIWPNLLEQARGRGVRTALISARLSKASLSGWARFPATATRVFGGFDLILTQDDATADGLSALGARDDGRLNLKLCGAPLPLDVATLDAHRRTAGGVPILLAASTHPGEEEIVLDAFAPLADRARLVIAPRHPDRGEAVAALAAARGFTVSRQGAGQAFANARVHVADGLGELGLWFSLAASTLVGGGLLPGPGGHNPLEPARLRAPQLRGPAVSNWTLVYATLGATAPTVADADGLTTAWKADLDDPAAAQARADQAFAVSQTGDDALGKATDRLLTLIERGP